MHLNGKLTLGENTADNGGLRLAYMALMDNLAKHMGAKDKPEDGYSHSAQRFFLGWGQVWCASARPEAKRMRAQIDPHSPRRSFV